MARVLGRRMLQQPIVLRQGRGIAAPSSDPGVPVKLYQQSVPGLVARQHRQRRRGSVMLLRQGAAVLAPPGELGAVLGLGRIHRRRQARKTIILSQQGLGVAPPPTSPGPPVRPVLLVQQQAISAARARRGQVRGRALYVRALRGVPFVPAPTTGLPYELPLQIDRSLDQVANVVHVTNAGGSTFTATASLAQRKRQGTRELSISVQIDDPIAAAGMATWILASRSAVLPRVLELRIDVNAAKDALLPHVLGDGLGTRITLTHTLNNGGTWSITGLLDGIGVKLSRSEFYVSYYLDVLTASAPVPSW